MGSCMTTEQILSLAPQLADFLDEFSADWISKGPTSEAQSDWPEHSARDLFGELNQR